METDNLTQTLKDGEGLDVMSGGDGRRMTEAKEAPGRKNTDFSS